MNVSRPNARLQYADAMKYPAYRLPTNEEWAQDWDVMVALKDATIEELRARLSDEPSAKYDTAIAALVEITAELISLIEAQQMKMDIALDRNDEIYRACQLKIKARVALDALGVEWEGK